MTRELKGIHVLMIAVTCFGIIIAANLTMLFAATGSFPGLVVKNSYVASQKWNDRTAAQSALGWQAGVTYGDGVVRIALTAKDAPVENADLVVTIGRPSRDDQDKIYTAKVVPGGYEVAADLAPGRWRVEVATATGPAFTKTAQIVVAP